MHNSSDFTDKDIKAIEEKVNRKYDAALRKLLILATPFCLLAPYLPKRSGNRSIDTLDYGESVLRFGIIWALILIAFAVWYPYSTKKQISNKRKFLKKRSTTTQVKSKIKACFKSYDYEVKTDLKGNMNTLELNENQIDEVSVGDDIRIEFEEQTNTILDIIILSKNSSP